MDDEFEGPASAIFLGDLDGLQEVLDTDPSWATKTSSVGHSTLLELVACEAQNIENPVGSARLLLQAGAKTHSPLVSAAGCNSHDVLALLLDEGVGIEGEAVWTPLDEAVYWANHDIAAFLVERGASVRALSTAAGLGDVQAMEGYFNADGSLHEGAGPIASPFADTVPGELADDPESIVDHAFVMAANAGKKPSAEWLLERGARVNSVPPGYHWKGTALHAACWRGEAELVRWLIGAGADPTIRDGLADSDAVGWAIHHGHPELVPILKGE